MSSPLPFGGDFYAHRNAMLADIGALELHNQFEAGTAAGRWSEAFSINARIALDDDIFRFFLHHPYSIHPIRDYLSDGWRTLNELNGLLAQERLFLQDVGSFLEFASGHGRFTRHLAPILEERLTVSDVVPSSMTFAAEEFKAQTLLSTLTPHSFHSPTQYQVVFVLSMFTHLPLSTWTPWLHALWTATAPGGRLIISLHGTTAAQRMGLTLADNDFIFRASSESQALSAEHYGTTFTGPQWVRDQAANLPQLEAQSLREALFWGAQDAWVLRKAMVPK